MLKPNDVVDIILPGTSCTFEEIKKIKNYVKKIGLCPNIFLEKETVIKKAIAHEFASIAAETRFAQLKKAIENKDSKIIWCARGGYGSAELLPFLMKMQKPKQQKIFIGFSDISSINIFLIKQWNWKVISAPVLTQLALNKVSEKSKKAISDLLFGKTKELKYSINITHPTPVILEPGVQGSREFADKLTRSSALQAKDDGVIKNHGAIIVGGCISVISAHFGTKNQIDWNGKILFLEDEGEDGERLDRYFFQLVTIMSEQKKYPAAIVLGNFLEANPHGTPKAKNIEMAIAKFASNLAEKKLPIPLFVEKTKCLGHSKNMMPLILGAKTKITSDNFLIQTL